MDDIDELLATLPPTRKPLVQPTTRVGRYQGCWAKGMRWITLCRWRPATRGRVPATEKP